MPRSMPFFDFSLSSLQPLELSGQESMLHISFRLGGIPLNCAPAFLVNVKGIHLGLFFDVVLCMFLVSVLVSSCLDD